MSLAKLFLMMTGFMVLSVCTGCEGGGDSGGGSGSLGGTWTGTTAGRPLTIVLEQDGTSLSGSYKLQNPDFGENLSGTASGTAAPATATLVAGGDRSFQLTFNSATSMGGGFFKGTTQVGTVKATKQP